MKQVFIQYLLITISLFLGSGTIYLLSGGFPWQFNTAAAPLLGLTSLARSFFIYENNQ